MELSSTADALRDAQRSVKKGIRFDVELDNCRRILEDKDTDSAYHHYILHVLGKARENGGHKKKRANEEWNGMHKGHLYPMPGRKNTGKRVMEEKDTDSEYRHYILHDLGKARENGGHKKKRENVYIDLVEDSDSEELNRRGKRHSCMMPGRKNTGKRVMKEKDTYNEYQHFQRPISGKAKINESHKRKRGSVFIDLVEDSDSEELKRRGKGHSCMMPGRKNAGKDGGANRKAVVRTDKERLHQKPRQKNNRMMQYQNEHVDQDRSVGKHKELMCEKFKKRIVVKLEFKVNKKAKVMADNENFHQGRRNNLAVRNHCERVDRQPGKKVGQGKHGVSHHKTAVKKEPDDGVKTRLHTEKVHNKNRSAKTALGKDVGKSRKGEGKGEGDHVLSCEKAAFGKKSVKIEPDDVKTAKTAFGNSAVKIEAEDVVKTGLHTEEVNNNIMSVKTEFGKDVAEGQKKLMKVGHGSYSVKIEPGEGVKTRQHTKNVKSKMNKEDNSEVEILDGAAIVKGMPGPFVPSVTDTDLLHNLVSPTLDEFRKELLELLNKPYDRMEYKQHREAIRTGSFFKHYPDLGGKLKIHRYRRKKCLTIVRGFFFWLQNVSRDGAFKPWKDRHCLAIEPASP